MNPNVEALAVYLAEESLQDYMYGDHWMGWPDPKDDAQMAKALEQEMPDARRRAARYLGIARAM